MKYGETFMNRIVYTLLIFAVVSFSSASFAQRSGPKGPTGVIISPVVKGDFSDQVEALGTTKANESVVITADRSEKIATIHFEDGQEVKQGDLLVTLDKTQEEAELRASQALTAQTQTSYNRARGLSGNSALPKATLQERLAELKQAQAATEAIKARLESYEITAPFDGVLGLREMSVGTLVQPGDMITTIHDLSQIKVDFDVPSVFLKTLKPGLPIRGTVEAFGAREFEGAVRTVNTQIDPVTRTVKVRATMPNVDGVLKPGLLMSINLFKNPRQALLIPEEALIKRSDKNFVYVVTQDGETLIAKQTEIKLGARKPGTIEVLSGLNKDDKIVVHGTVKLRDGAEVSIRAEENEDASLDELLKQKPSARKGE
jgi:membrane fusion protein (multidrug efflux system)